MPGGVQQSGKQARGRVGVGMALEMLRIFSPMLGPTDEGVLVDEVVAKLSRKFRRPPQDLMASELKFMGSQLGVDGAGPQAQQAPQGPPQIPSPAPPPMPMAA